MYKKHRDKVAMFLLLYVDDILLIGNDVGVMLLVKVLFSSQFDMKDLGEANFILGIKLWQDRKNKMLGLSQARYIDKVLEQFSMKNSKKGLLPFRHGVPLSNDQRPKTLEEENMMRQVPYTYEEAMNDIDAQHWVKAMKSKLDSMYSNQVWDLVKAPNGIKLVGCK